MKPVYYWPKPVPGVQWGPHRPARYQVSSTVAVNRQLAAGSTAWAAIHFGNSDEVSETAQ